jgi:branched-chain amino acid transport system ATP-binding protein
VKRRLECRGLTGGRGRLVAFRDVDLCVEPGQVLAVLGPNGAGKTTLLLTLAGMLEPQAGTVSVDGGELRGGRPAAANRAGLVFVPDNRCLFTTLTVEENLRSAAHPSKRSPREVLDVFPALEARWSVRAGALSGGEQQMLAMARALIQDPKVLLVDEVSMGLAPIIVNILFEAIRRIADDRGCAVVLVEQHVSLVLDIADRAAVLSRGTIVLEGAASDLRADAGALERAYFGGEVEGPTAIAEEQ